MHPLRTTRLRALAGFEWLERRFDRVFGSGLNPLRQLGAIGCMLLCVLATSGIYLYAVLDSSADGAYRSIDQLSRQQWYLGGVVRSLHRYAADAFVVVLLAHMLREALLGRYSGFRRFSWWTGVPLLPLAFAIAIGGFWLNWDQLGQFSAIATAELLDHLPLFASPMTRNFLDAAAVSDRLFSLFIFVHLGLPLLLLFGLWFHLQRLAYAAIFPPRALAAGVLMSLVALALAAPVASHAPANMALVPQQLALDWFLLFIHPLAYATSAGVVWAVLLASLAGLCVLPLLPQPAPEPVAVVDPANCNGCRRCFDDCPYAAVTMVTHPIRGMRQLARVDPDLCASCGICVGACPSSTPFRSVAELVTGIDMPSAPIGALRRRLTSGLAALGHTPHKIVLFGCRHGADVHRFASSDVVALDLLCTAQMPPSFVEYALRDGAAAVVVSACGEGACAFRLGRRWTAARLAGTREPRLRASAARDRLATVWAGAGDEPKLRAALDALRRRFAGEAASTRAGTSLHAHG